MSLGHLSIQLGRELAARDMLDLEETQAGENLTPRYRDINQSPITGDIKEGRVRVNRKEGGASGLRNMTFKGQAQRDQTVIQTSTH